MMRIGVVKETGPGERRVAAVPAVIPRLRELGAEVVVEHDAGLGAFLSDSAYVEAGATAAGPAAVDGADIVLCVGPPDPVRLRPGQVLIGLLDPLGDPDRIAAYAEQGVTAVALELLPRTLSRAQSMDALTSQATIAGYKAAILAADTYGGYFPMLMTAAGTAKPAQVLVLGVGVAGLAAIGTAKRLGAIVTGYDIRPETRDEVRSVGARFLELDGVAAKDGAGGYARALTDEEREAQQEALMERIGDFDVVLTTALVPGRKPPLLVTEEALKGMRPGSVVVDLAAGPLGGNVQGVVPDRTTVTNGVTLIGAGNLPSAMAPAASTAYARNLAAVAAHLVANDLSDEILAAMVVTHEGRVLK